MGAGKSKANAKSASLHKNCSCDLWMRNNYQHCCRNQCLIGTSKQEMEAILCASLKQYNAEFLTSTIMQYIDFPADKFDIVQMHLGGIATHHQYTCIAYTYPPIVELIESCKPPCSVWHESIDGKKEFVKTVVCGDTGVGKSALSVRFVTDMYVEDFDPTIEDYYRKQMFIHGAEYLVDVLDTAGKEQFPMIEDEWLRFAKILLICFAVNNRTGWDHVELYRQRILKTKQDQSDWTIVLVATKCDLVQDRIVSRQEIIEKAMQWNVPMVETSAKEKINVSLVFEQAIYAYWMNSFCQCLNRDLQD